ncbi:sporulation protein [Diplocarpon rosae]|nr:sporulation protein [Diplocarpon rosae]
MDPFEVRVRFTGFLSNMTASVTSSNKAAQYALKFRDLDEDLHSCILEQLERNGNSMNNRANIMFFIEHLCDMAARENHYDYIRMMQRDILRIVDAVAPENGAGAANVKVDDFELYAEEATERAKCAAEWKDEFMKKATGTDGIGHGQTHL